MAYDEGLAQRVREIVHGRSGVTERKMFGGLAFMAHGHMFIGVLGRKLMARVGPQAYAQALTEPHVHEMDFTGKPLKGYVYVEFDGIEADSALASWVDKCCDFAATLPPKLPK